MIAGTLFVLGASDPEMTTIERLVKEAGYSVTYAMHEGQRVRPETAYRADPCGTYSAVWVECAPITGIPRGATIVDHHKPGDPGFGKQPDQYWVGSSLGQVCDLLGIEPNEELRIVAAADHCLSAAYHGRCPGVDPVALRQWRATSRAAFQRIPVEELTRKVEQGMETLRTLPLISIGGYQFADARGQACPELPEASAITGITVLYSLQDFKTKRIKVGVLNGDKEALEAWMEWAKAKYVDVYGDPTRGYAGAYQP